MSSQLLFTSPKRKRGQLEPVASNIPDRLPVELNTDLQLTAEIRPNEGSPRTTVAHQLEGLQLQGATSALSFGTNKLQFAKQKVQFWGDGAEAIDDPTRKRVRHSNEIGN